MNLSVTNPEFQELITPITNAPENLSTAISYAVALVLNNYISVRALTVPTDKTSLYGFMFDKRITL